MTRIIYYVAFMHLKSTTTCALPSLKIDHFLILWSKHKKILLKKMRKILVDWLVEVSEEYTLVPDTLYLTVYLADWFLHGNYMERQRLQLLGITCMLIAS